MSIFQPIISSITRPLLGIKKNYRGSPVAFFWKSKEPIFSYYLAMYETDNVLEIWSKSFSWVFSTTKTKVLKRNINRESTFNNRYYAINSVKMPHLSSNNKCRNSFGQVFFLWTEPTLNLKILELKCPFLDF